MRSITASFLATGLIILIQPVESCATKQQKMRLNPAIQAPKPERVNEITSRQWPNPSIEISDHVISVIWGGRRQQYKTMQPEEVEGFMVRLPVSAWPYGRIIEVSESALHSGGNTEMNYRVRSRTLVEAAMKRLHVTVQLGPPSA